MLEIDDFELLHCPGGSASSEASCFPQEFDWSPETVMTAATTPPKSPAKIRECGPILLPKVRPQDQLMEPATVHGFSQHNRTSSLPAHLLPNQFGAMLPQRPVMDRRSTSPPTGIYMPSPVSAPSPFDHMINDSASSRRPSLANARSHSTSNIHSHSRNGSSSSIDASNLRRYGYPTYRQSPTPQPIGNVVPMSRTSSAMSHLAPITMPGGQIQSYPNHRRTASPPANPSRLSIEQEFDPVLDGQTMSTLDYLTAPNPTPSLTQRTVETVRGQNVHFWFDVRNVRAWSDFNVTAVAAIPDLWKLLEWQVPLRNLPTPARVNLNPETPSQLAELCAAHHAVKINAALRFTQGSERHMAMRTLKATQSPRQQPEFVSNYQSDSEKTIYGDGRGRIVGIVKCYDQWNTGMRNSTPGDKIKYLQTLAHLHRFMREHGTRYGFIMTEIELVCVRAGGPPNPEDTRPLFGFLEVAAPVQIAASGRDESGKLGMTAGLALWWLHMLAKEQPLPGQMHWKMEVGHASELSRQHHEARDDWMPKQNVSEKREAKRVRGWVEPSEPLSKREYGRGRRGKA